MPESGVRTEFRKRLETTRPRGVSVTVRLACGKPSQRLDERVTLSATGRMRLKVVRDELRPSRVRKAVVELRPIEASKLLEQLEKHVGELLPRQEARFVPGSVVGTITLQAGREREVFYFNVDKDLELVTPRAAPLRAVATKQGQRVPVTKTPTGRLARRRALAGRAALASAIPLMRPPKHRRRR